MAKGINKMSIDKEQADLRVCHGFKLLSEVTEIEPNGKKQITVAS